MPGYLPATVPKSVANVLARAMSAALTAPGVRERFRNLDLVIEAEGAGPAGDRLAKARERYAATIRATGMKVD